MKKIILLLMVMCSFTFSYSQEELDVRDLLTFEEGNFTENDLDIAFSAPLNKFVGKKWYIKWYSNGEYYIIFNNNKTGAFIREKTDNDYTSPFKMVYKITFKWNRKGNDLTITTTPHLDIATPVASSMTQLSPRVKAEVKKDYAELQAEFRASRPTRYNYRIGRITDDFLILQNSNYRNDVYFSKKKLDEIVSRQKK